MSIKLLNECGILLPEQWCHQDTGQHSHSPQRQEEQQERCPQHQASELRCPTKTTGHSFRQSPGALASSQFSDPVAPFHSSPSRLGQSGKRFHPSTSFSSPGFPQHHRPPEAESLLARQNNPIRQQQQQHRHPHLLGASQLLPPGPSLTGEVQSPGSRQRLVLQGPAPPKNVMMSVSGGVALLSGPSSLLNSHDPYSSQQPAFRSGEVGRPNFSFCRSSSKASNLSQSNFTPSRLSPRMFSSHPSSDQFSTPNNRSSRSQTLSVGNSVVEESSLSGGAERPSSTNDWINFLTTTAATNGSTGGDYGTSFSTGFGVQDGRASGRSEGSGGSGFGDEGRSGGLGNGDGGSNGDDGNDGGDGSGMGYKEKEKAARKANPLVDLIETETAFVAELGKIIKKVAGAWSRSNFPPAELDTMFRNIESIYRVNRSFLKSLKEIGPNPSSPRALGDLLMRWIDDLEAPYLRYCDNYFTDFDNWPSVQTNAKLPPLLVAVSESTQADGTPIIFSDKKRQVGHIWTLDQLFALPQIRLKYYKKLYARLLKSTQTGRSDHRLLIGANEKLDELLQRAKKRIAMSVLDEGLTPPSNMRKSQESSGGETSRNTLESPLRGQRISSATSHSAAAKEDSLSSAPPSLLGRTDGFTSPALSPRIAARGPPSPIPADQDPSFTSSSMSEHPSVASDDLEARLDTSRTLDIFSMKTKKCQLRMNPPNIPFTRVLKKSADVVIYFTPSSTGQELVLRRAHIFLLSDLFLVCERKTPMERAEGGQISAADMWLLYPPLAGKHLRVTDNGVQGNSISVQILKKETLVIHTESREAKVEWMNEFEQCRQFATNLGLRVKTTTSEAIPGSVSLADSSLFPSREASNIPSFSPNISVTPVSRRSEEDDGTLQSPTIKDMTRLMEDMTSFSRGNPSGLDRGDSFNSFVVPTLKDPSMRQDDGERSILKGPSPTLTSAFNSTPEPISPAYPPNPLNHAGRPPVAQSFLPPLQFNAAASPSGNVASPPSSTLGREAGPAPQIGPAYQGGRPNMMFRPPPPPSQQMPRQGSMPNPQGPPSLPLSPPPLHLVNGSFQGHQQPPQQQRPPRPPPHMNGNGQPGMMYGRPMPPRPYAQNSFGPSSTSATNYGNGHGNGIGIGNSNGIGPPRPPFHQDPSRRPSAPDLRAQAGQQTTRRTSDGNGPPPERSLSSSSGPPRLPSDFMKQAGSRPKEEYSPPSSPTKKKKGPKTSTVAAQMRCRLYLKQSHAQWKSLGNARIKVFHLMPDDVKQLVVENDKKSTPIISSIILPDGVERVGKVGVAIELSDNGNRTGIIYMIHLRSEESAFALFGQLLEGSDRTVLGAEREAL
ncbi:hypothetical protein CBS101457_005906 [Exobasidium rhododendri]|nr:hypothetical protein CBS101457_005906 [Exobasidium rhododendri]